VVIEDLCTSVFQTYQRPSAHSVGQPRCSDADIPPQVVTNQKGGFQTFRFWMPRPVNGHSPIGWDWPEAACPLSGVKPGKQTFTSM
jgi:hypothetical protein